MLVAVPELAAARGCGDMFIPVFKECSTWGLCVLRSLPCARAAPWRCCSWIWGPEEKPDLLQQGHSVWDLEPDRTGGFDEACEASLNCICRHRETRGFFPEPAEFCCISLPLLVPSLPCQ